MCCHNVISESNVEEITWNYKFFFLIIGVHVGLYTRNTV